MTTLPTFIELLSSLGLDEKGSPPQRHGSPPSLGSPSAGSNTTECTRSSPPSREHSLGGSPAIVIDAPDAAKIRSLGPSFRSRGARYAPYGTEANGPFVRRGSVSSMDMPPIHSIHEEASVRKLGNSPPPSSRLIARRRPSMANLSLDPDAAQMTPISSLLRRRSPQPSPTTPAFRVSRRGSVASGTASPSPLTPPSVPALPTLPPMPSNYSFGTPTLRTMPSSELRSPRRDMGNLDELPVHSSPRVHRKTHSRSISAGSSNSSISRRVLKASSKA
ncbi:unnamed protein product [Rhizoctonia solani]|uniref:Uncharacterized protein n=1 Tax=Rhizoctonia solani TaxID=456999 RepID=A0A8H3E915_9AGAM|nr:unnamed protein product [Rhizoctonia solani]